MFTLYWSILPTSGRSLCDFVFSNKQFDFEAVLTQRACYEDHTSVLPASVLIWYDGGYPALHLIKEYKELNNGCYVMSYNIIDNDIKLVIKCRFNYNIEAYFLYNRINFSRNTSFHQSN